MTHVEFLVEEASMARVVELIVPRVSKALHFKVRIFNGKSDLLAKLPQRLAGYRHWPEVADLRVCVVVDRDADDRVALKARLEGMAIHAGLTIGSTSAGRRGTFLARLAIEELEAWFLADVDALRRVYPGVPRSLPTKAGFRNPDQVKGGTWEALERVLQEAGHEPGGLRKLVNAERLAPHLDIDNDRSPSFAKFIAGLRLFEEGNAA